MNLIYWFFRMLLIIFILFNLNVHYNIINQKNRVFKSFRIVEVYCKPRGGNSIFIKVGNGKKRIEIPKEKCYMLNKGDYIKLNFDEFSGKIYLPNTKEYLKISIMLIIILIFSFFNWIELRNKLINKLNRL